MISRRFHINSYRTVGYSHRHSCSAMTDRYKPVELRNIRRTGIGMDNIYRMTEVRCKKPADGIMLHLMGKKIPLGDKNDRKDSHGCMEASKHLARSRSAGTSIPTVAPDAEITRIAISLSSQRSCSRRSAASSGDTGRLQIRWSIADVYA